MREGEGRRKLRVTAGSLVLLAVTLITLDIRNADVVETFKSDVGDGLTGTDSFFSRLTSPIRNAWHGIGEYDELKERNAKLTAEVEALRSLAVTEQIAGEKLVELAELDQLVVGIPYDMVRARKTAGSGSNFDDDTMYIDKGKSSGLVEGMPVVIGAPDVPKESVAYPAQLVGSVEVVYQNKAMVRLISYPSMTFGVRLIQSKQIAVGHGGGSDDGTFRPWIIDVGLDLTAEVPQGDIAVTSSASEYPNFPPDIPVGKVTRKRLIDAENRQVLDVEPWVDIAKAEYVKVIVWTPKRLDEGEPPPTTAATTTTLAPDDGLLDPGESSAGTGTAGSSGAVTPPATAP